MIAMQSSRVVFYRVLCPLLSFASINNIRMAKIKFKKKLHPHHLHILVHILFILLLFLFNKVKYIYF